jgi:hypothetical protein
VILGNRDWIIPIECTPDTLVLYPARLRFPVGTLPRGDDPDQPLVQAVRQMIERRQASVRPGEPPYRPVVRFLVRPGGLRSYYVAYPLLQPLQVPMSRENLDRDEDVFQRMYDR